LDVREASQAPLSLATSLVFGVPGLHFGEAQRCLRCFSNIQLDVDKCVLCGLCVDVCPFDLISMVPAADFDAGAVGTALLLDEEMCIRCGLCIERCPTDALSMSTWVGVGALPMPQLAGVNA
jgi:ferredoxin